MSEISRIQEGKKIPEVAKNKLTPSIPPQTKLDEDRRPILCMNWKMNGEKKTIRAVLQLFNEDQTSKAQIILGVPACYIIHVHGSVISGISIAAQNIASEDKVIYSGEISGAMIKDCGALWVVVGCSERRRFFGENNKEITKKLGSALGASLNVIFCVGGTERRDREVISTQLLSIKSTLSYNHGTSVVVVYEPVWAKLTGENCTTVQAQEGHAYIRNWLKLNISQDLSKKTKLLYGGLVTDENVSELLSQKDIDGFYLGEESFSAKFGKIIQQMN